MDILRKNITSVLGKIIAFNLTYAQALENIETLRAAGVTQVNLPEHEIVTTEEERDDILRGDEKPWNNATDVFFTGTIGQDGRAYANVSAYAHGMTFKWGVKFEFCQSHGHLLLDTLPEVPRRELIQSMQKSADSKEDSARYLRKTAQETEANVSLIRSLYR